MVDLNLIPGSGRTICAGLLITENKDSLLVGDQSMGGWMKKRTLKWSEKR